MVSKNTKKIVIPIFGLVFIALLIFSFGGIGFTLFNEQVAIPKYWTGECVERAENMNLIQETRHTDDGQFYDCTTQGTRRYVPVFSGIQCDYQIKNSFSSSAYVCDLDSNDVDDDSCIKLQGKFTSSIDEEFVIDAGKKIWINSDKIFGDADLFVRYPSFGLRVRSADGFVNPTTTNCELNSLSTSLHTLDARNRILVQPDNPVNAVSGLTFARSTQLVTLDNVLNGEPIYITRPGFYQVVTEAEDGYKFVDTTVEFSDNSIECIPRTTGCSDDAQIVRLEDQSCDEFGGAITNFAPVQGDSTKLCKYECSAGSLDLTNDCVTVKQDSCSVTAPVYDSQTGECLTVEVQDDPTDINNNLLLAAIAIVGLIVIAAVRRKK